MNHPLFPIVSAPPPFLARLIGVIAAAMTFLAAPSIRAEPTQVAVSVISEGAKFIGDSVGGARITILDAESGEVLAKGITRGGTGDTEAIMKRRQPHHASVATKGAAAFTTTLDLDAPRLIRTEAVGPLDHPQARREVTTETLLIPGFDRTGDRRIVLTMTGLTVDASDTRVEGDQVVVSTAITMLCGCPFTPGGLWDADGLTGIAILSRNGRAVARAPLAHAGSPSQFSATLSAPEKGRYRLTVYAYQPSTGNVGIHRIPVTVTSDG